jgi:hypothetical protein
MAERLCQEVAQFLADRVDDQTARGLARARIAVSLAEGLDGEVGGPRDRATAAEGPGRLSALLDHGLPQSERDAVVAALAHDAMRRAEASSAAAFLDGINNACPPLPAGLMARAVDTFEYRASPKQVPTVCLGQWSRSWLPRWGLRPSLAALVLVAVLTPVVLSLIWDERNASVRDGGPIARSLAPLPGKGEETSPDRSIGKPAARSCGPTVKAAQDDQLAGGTHKAETDATEPVGGEMRKAEERGAAHSLDASADDPCRTQSSSEDGRAPARPPAGARN